MRGGRSRKSALSASGKRVAPLQPINKVPEEAETGDNDGGADEEDCEEESPVCSEEESVAGSDAGPKAHPPPSCFCLLSLPPRPARTYYLTGPLW